MRIILFLLLFAGSLLHAQDARLAQQYFNDGEYEKAASVYQALYQKNPASEGYFNRYLDCLMALRKFEECEDLVRREISKRPKEVTLYVSYGNLLSRRNETDKAERQYQEAIDRLQGDVSMIHRLANSFSQITRYDLAIQTFEKGEKLMKNQIYFTYNLADMYRRKGDLETMVRYFLDGL
ncbi:MAG TPA: tetratricopeptide repeat protein, partial [Saprospiraceae bacterium]|nr:tetratricopeptide repeat protein [Saprospiraceae bacterium]